MPYNLYISGPLIPLKTFEFARKKYLKLKNVQSYGPTDGKLWRVIGGSIYHHTGTASKLLVVNTLEKSPVTMAEYYQEYAAAIGTGWKALENLPTLLIMHHKDVFTFTGGVNAYATLIMLEANDELSEKVLRKGFWKFL